MYVWFKSLKNFKKTLKIFFPNNKFKAFKIEDALMIRPLIYRKERLFLVLEGLENIKSFLKEFEDLIGTSTTSPSRLKLNLYMVNSDLFLRTLKFEENKINMIFVPKNDGHLVVTFSGEKTLLILKHFDRLSIDEKQLVLNACKPFNVVKCNRVSEELISQ